MSIDKKQLELNVNLYSLKPNFLNYELHYVIASNENTFRFAQWNDRPGENENKFYFFLTDQELYIPAGGITLQQSYVLQELPVYPCVSNYEDFQVEIEKVKKDGVGKSIRCFSAEQADSIKQRLEETYGSVMKHVVTSSQGQHLLLVFQDIEISVSTTMVYFRRKSIVNEVHYEHVKEEGEIKLSE